MCSSVTLTATCRGRNGWPGSWSEAYFEPTRWTTQEWAAALVLVKENPDRFVPVRIEDVSVPEILAPALFGLPASEARAELLRVVKGDERLRDRVRTLSWVAG
jgi:hypothetical protein